MELKKNIKNWFKHFQQYFFTYKDGFFELSYLYNSPETLIECLKKMPFNYHFPKQNLIKTGNPFVKGVLQYCKLEDGLWITATHMNYKQNISFKSIYDEHIESGYYCLSFNIAENKIAKSSYDLKNLTITNTTWVLLKPMAVSNATCIKGCHIYYYTIYIHKNWLIQNIIANSSLDTVELKAFLNSDVNCKIWSDNSKFPHKVVEPIQTIFDVLKEKNELNTLKLKLETSQLILSFFTEIFNKNSGVNQYAISNKDQVKILKIENYLLENLTAKFEGIDALATQFSISPTKLKTDFKNVYGMPVFTFFQQKQMELANEYLQFENYRINQIASLFHYENGSKFAATFKKHQGLLPSEIARKN